MSVGPSVARPAARFDLDRVGVSVDERALLAEITLDISPGRVHGLIGHNGSGKSTLLKVVARQVAATSGSVRFGETALESWASRDFARAVAYLPQTTSAATGLTVRELAMFGRYPWHGAFGRVTADDRARVEEAIDLLHLRPFAERLVDTLSGGERQRAWIAMLVAQDSGFILLDEPISALDLAQQIEVLGLVRDLARSRGTGIVAVLHEINMAARFCDELIALKSGRLAARGPPAELMRPDVLEMIYGIPMHVLPHPAGGMFLGVPR